LQTETGIGSGMGEKIEKTYGLLWTEQKWTAEKCMFWTRLRALTACYMTWARSRQRRSSGT